MPTAIAALQTSDAAVQMTIRDVRGKSDLLQL